MQPIFERHIHGSFFLGFPESVDESYK